MRGEEEEDVGSGKDGRVTCAVCLYVSVCLSDDSSEIRTEKCFSMCRAIVRAASVVSACTRACSVLSCQPLPVQRAGKVGEWCVDWEKGLQLGSLCALGYIDTRRSPLNSPGKSVRRVGKRFCTAIPCNPCGNSPEERESWAGPK